MPSLRQRNCRAADYGRGLGSAALVLAVAAASALALAQETTPGPVRSPQAWESLDRGLIALRSSEREAYVGWRLLASDPTDVAFHLYRTVGDDPPARLNDEPLRTTTDFVDREVDWSRPVAYYVRPLANATEMAPSRQYALPAEPPIRQFVEVPLQRPPAGATAAGDSYEYSANDASVADLDGDGQYEIVLKWEPTNARDNSRAGLTGPVYLDAYRLDGQRLWRIDLGRNIRAGAHYTPFIAFDFDGDGRAELAVRTAPGTLDGTGAPALLPGDRYEDDYRAANGYVVTGPEYLTVFDGRTGAARASLPFEPARGHVTEWGDAYGNRADRFLAGVGWLDGARPSLIFSRGYYGPQPGGRARNEIVAYDFDGATLRVRWHFCAGQGIHDDLHREYVGQGAHSLVVADVDDDGRDEIVYGAAAIDDDGAPLHSTGLGHGDALHVADMLPERPGLEVFMPHESADRNGHVGFSVRDAATGEIVFFARSTGDVGRGVAADIDPRHPGYEFWATTRFPGETRSVYGSTEEPLYPAPRDLPYNFLAWWDGDPSRELLDDVTVSKWTPAGLVPFDLDPGRTGVQSQAPDVASNNGSKRTPALTADMWGDWREEIVWRRRDDAALRIFTSVIPAVGRWPTLMHDSQYRAAVAGQNVGYNQPPHPRRLPGSGEE